MNPCVVRKRLPCFDCSQLCFNRKRGLCFMGGSTVRIYIALPGQNKRNHHEGAYARKVQINNTLVLGRNQTNEHSNKSHVVKQFAFYSLTYHYCIEGVSMRATLVFVQVYIHSRMESYLYHFFLFFSTFSPHYG